MEPSNSPSNEDVDPRRIATHHVPLTVVLSVIALAILVAILFTVWSKSAVNEQTFPENTVTEIKGYEAVKWLSTSGEDPTALQNYFVQKVTENKNDSETRSAIYWITHRYFDNGGDIYEIYNFIDKNPSVSFLKEAESIYPAIFESLRAGTVTNYSRESLLALLAYYEVIDNHNYSSIAIWGLAANKYSEQASINITESSDTPEVANERSIYFKTMIAGAQKFINRAEYYLIKGIIKTGSLNDLRNNGVSDEDLLVGLNQYASAVANLKGIGVSGNAGISIDEIFEFDSNLAKNEVPRLYFFTNYLYATALVKSGETNPERIAIPLDRVMEYVSTNPDQIKPKGVIDRVIKSRINREGSLFSYELAKKLASLHTPFKNWLRENGWQESDF